MKILVLIRRRGGERVSDIGKIVANFGGELRSCDYYHKFQEAKIFYVDIMWSKSFCLDLDGRFSNNTAYFIPSDSRWLLSVLNSPIGWAYAWRNAQHGKDEALRYFTTFVENFPIPNIHSNFAYRDYVGDIVTSTANLNRGRSAITDWLRIEFGILKPGSELAEVHRLEADEFVGAVRRALPKSRKLSAADIARLKQEHATTVEPARLAAAEVLRLERRLSDLVNEAYGLTPEEVALMWSTAPPRMPFTP